MLNRYVDDLMKRLSNIFLEPKNAIERLKEIKRVDIDTLRKLERIKAKIELKWAEIIITTKRRVYPFVRGDILRITNCLRDE